MAMAFKKFRFGELDAETLARVASALELDESKCVRFLIHAKAREMGLDSSRERVAARAIDPEPAPVPMPAPKASRRKKRRAS
jgi:hypothetical protein